MHLLKKIVSIAGYKGFLLLTVAFFFIVYAQNPGQPAWPDISQQTKPWTRWWWMGNSVNKNDLTAAMESYKKAGLGGLEITPIYGVKGYEDKFIPYLSPEWVKMFIYTLQEGKRLDLGIDMATGTGWPFGGPYVDSDNACKYVTYKTYTLKTGEKLSDPVTYTQVPIVRAVGHKVDISELVEPISANKNLQKLALDQVRFKKPLPLQTLMAYSDQGKVLDLTKFVDDSGRLNWTAPDGTWTLYAVFMGWHGKMVERAAPGGEGNVIDHFSAKSVLHYLQRFDQAFQNNDINGLRAFFNDSYEVDDARGQADWTPEFFGEFQKRRGYDLHMHLPDLFAKGTTEKSRRILCDYRETISDLLLDEFTETWTKWANSKNSITRDQAHGSPANILDLYAASNIPETEGNDLAGIKFASSAANVTGKKLTSSETATWLNEHFLSSLGDVKKAVDHCFIGGVNHIVYHGTAFSPQNETWPGWIFYAAVNFGPANTFWNDFPVLNAYVARCQSFLQNSRADNDILLYFPYYDLISQAGKEMLQHISSRTSQLPLSDFNTLSHDMIGNGYALDYISDRQIMNLNFEKGQLVTNNSSYKTLVLPQCNFLSTAILERLLDLAEKGANIVIHNNLPADVPGYNEFEKRREKLQNLISRLHFTNINNSDIQQAEIGKGKVLLGSDLNDLLSRVKVTRELMVDKGLQYIRKNYKDNKIYFISNPGNSAVDGWIPVNAEASSVVIYNPMNKAIGLAGLRKSDKNYNEIFLQLAPGGSCILRTFTTSVSTPDYPYIKTSGKQQNINGTWTIEFIKGGPVLPETIKTDKLDSWTNIGDENTRAFSGTATYSIEFDLDKKTAANYLLDLGQVCESAVVIFNDKEIGSLISSPFQCIIPAEMIKERNRLKIIISNLMANHIAYLDQHHINWKKFYNVNFPAKLPENRGDDGLFTAINWKPKKSGLLGPVTLTPITEKQFN